MKRISLQPVHHILATKEMTVNQLLSQMTKTGVMGGGKLGRAADIYEMMLKDKECTKFFGLAGAMVPGGMKQIIIDMINDGWIDVLVTTGANLTHDLGEALGYRHYHSQEKISDAELHKQRLDRMFDSYMPDEIYEGLEDFFTKVLPKLPKERMGISRFLREIAPQIPTKHPSILRACYEKNIPIYCPALADSGIGLQIWNYIQRHNLDVLAFEDLKESRHFLCRRGSSQKLHTASITAFKGSNICNSDYDGQAGTRRKLRRRVARGDKLGKTKRGCAFCKFNLRYDNCASLD